MVLASFFGEFVNLFTQMHWVVAVLIIAGFVFCLVEAAVPGFGLFGILGLTAEIAGVITHAFISGSVAQVFCLLILVSFAIVILFLLFIRSAKCGLLAKSALVENKSSIPNDYKEKAENELKPLIGMEGLTLTECHPVGKIRIGQNTYEAQSKSSIIQKGEVIKVVAIEDARIMIDKITY